MLFVTDPKLTEFIKLFLVINTIIFRYKLRQILRSKLHQCRFIKGCKAWSGLLYKYTCRLPVYFQKIEVIRTFDLSLDRSIQRKTCTSVKQSKIAYRIQTNKMSKIHIHSSSTFKIWVHATAVQYYLCHTFFYYLVILRSNKENILQVNKNMNNHSGDMEGGKGVNFNYYIYKLYNCQ